MVLYGIVRYCIVLLFNYYISEALFLVEMQHLYFELVYSEPPLQHKSLAAIANPNTRPSASFTLIQVIQSLPLPRAPYLFGILLKGIEIDWAKLFPARLLLRSAVCIVLIQMMLCCIVNLEHLLSIKPLFKKLQSLQFTMHINILAENDSSIHTTNYLSTDLLLRIGRTMVTEYPFALWSDLSRPPSFTSKNDLAKALYLANGVSV